ncbi:hypothetical protein [Microbacterium sp. NPDC056234]|uniref:hypothetical protein n=1 Tax=Microbacterium sp. NPDC056234 TaxID=3345757 RepID=UPI0035DAF106
MRRALPWLLGTALVLGAGVAVAITPSNTATTQAFLVHGDADEAATGRTLTAQVRDASFAERITVDDGEWDASGNWLVVTVVASAPRTEVGASIHLATLVIGDRTFQASERPRTSLLGADLRVGTDTVGMLAFELPPDVDAGVGELRLVTGYTTPHLDDVVVLPVSLDDLPSAAEIDVTEPAWEWS